MSGRRARPYGTPGLERLHSAEPATHPQPFYYDGLCAEHLRELGFSDVVHEKKDFFALCKDQRFMKSVSFIWDNPPYTNATTKEAVLRALLGTGKAFCMLLPSSVLHTRLLRDLLDMSLVQVVFPRRVMVCKTGGKMVPFKYLIWLCYKMKLQRDVYFVDTEGGDEGDDADGGGIEGDAVSDDDEEA